MSSPMKPFTDERAHKIAVWHQVLADFRDAPPAESQVRTAVDATALAAFPTQSPSPTIVEFQQKDCVYAAIDQVRAGLKPLLLNMASDYVPGGGVGKGCSAQEEDLFRRSDYFRHLHPKYYPLRGVTTVLSEQVLFYRLAGNENYELMHHPTKIDCLAAAALRKPATTHGGSRFANPADKALMKSKIRALFFAALQHGNDCLVLSAWGCGAFRGPTADIARLFREVVRETEGKLSKVVFAIHDAHTFREFKEACEGAM